MRWCLIPAFPSGLVDIVLIFFSCNAAGRQMELFSIVLEGRCIPREPPFYLVESFEEKIVDERYLPFNINSNVG